MPRNEDGEMELVLGNRQLLSVLFVLVVLLGVFFTMGYIVGRNNPSEEKLRVAAMKQTTSGNKLPPTTVDPPSGSTAPKPSPSEVKPPVEVAKVEPPKVEPPKPEPPKAETKKKEEPKKKEEAKKKEEPKKQPELPKVTPPPVSAGGVFTETPTSGMYLQVSATDRPGATGMAEAYRKQGLNAYITPSSSATLFRVIIGPLPNNDAVADVKTKLKKLGVEGSILRKY